MKFKEQAIKVRNTEHTSDQISFYVKEKMILASYNTTHHSASEKRDSLFRKSNTVSESNTASENNEAVFDMDIADRLLSASTGPVPYSLTNDYMFRAVMQKSVC